MMLEWKNDIFDRKPVAEAPVNVTPHRPSEETVVQPQAQAQGWLHFVDINIIFIHEKQITKM